MLDLCFITEFDQLLIRAKSDIQLLAFSATIPERLEHFFKKYLKNPQYIKINDERLPKTIEHQLIAIKHRDKIGRASCRERVSMSVACGLRIRRRVEEVLRQ